MSADYAAIELERERGRRKMLSWLRRRRHDARRLAQADAEAEDLAAALALALRLHGSKPVHDADTSALGRSIMRDCRERMS